MVVIHISAGTAQSKDYVINMKGLTAQIANPRTPDEETRFKAYTTSLPPCIADPMVSGLEYNYKQIGQLNSLTGYEFYLYPSSYKELSHHYGASYAISLFYRYLCSYLTYK